MATSSIEWTELTWKPTTGCDKVSAGCKYWPLAEAQPDRYPLGDCRRRERGEPEANESRVGGGDSRPMRGERCGILLQALGRTEQKGSGSAVGRTGVQRLPSRQNSAGTTPTDQVTFKAPPILAISSKKTDLVTGSYQLPAPPANSTVAVKIIDMLGEEVVVRERV